MSGHSKWHNIQKTKGAAEFKTADIVEDFNILAEARRVAAEVTSLKDWQVDPKWSVMTDYLKNEDVFD